MLLEKIMKKRGFANGFLRPKYGEFEKLPDVEVAAQRIKEASERGEKVLIYGDYDADGVTASTVMREVLRLMGLSAEVMLPDRFKDGYGMSERLVEQAVTSGVKLVITVDCGSNNYEIIEKLRDKGVEVVVTDHHEILGKLPEAVAVVNPKRKDKPAPGSLQNLAGVGVAFMVAYELMCLGAIPEGQEKWLLDMVLIGTICDSMMMAGANRTLCYYGMKVLGKTRRVGLKELMVRAGVKRINSEAVGFQIGPRINAAGRMKSAELAFNLINVESRMEATKLAGELEELNNQRKTEQRQAVAEIAQREQSEEPVMIEVGEWHEGVLGIIAGRLVEEYHKPAFVLTETGEILKGSGRSFGEFNLAQALRECQDCLVGGGGHAGACGVKVLKDNLEQFRIAINRYYKSLNLQNQERFLEVEADLKLTKLGALTVEEVEALAQLEPYGEGNLEPVLLLENMEIIEVAKLGEEQNHLKLTLKDEDGKSLKVMAFYAPEEWLGMKVQKRADVWVNVVINEWQGLKSVEGRIVNIRLVK